MIVTIILGSQRFSDLFIWVYVEGSVMLQLLSLPLSQIGLHVGTIPLYSVLCCDEETCNVVWLVGWLVG